MLRDQFYNGNVKTERGAVMQAKINKYVFYKLLRTFSNLTPPSPPTHPKKKTGAVVLRVAKSWLRIGSLEILSQSKEIDLLRCVF